MGKIFFAKSFKLPCLWIDPSTGADQSKLLLFEIFFQPD